MTNMNRRNALQWAGLLSGSAIIKNLKYLDAWDHKIDAWHASDSDSDKKVRLCYNENPYGPSENMRNAMIKAFDQAYMYPTGTINELKDLLATELGVTTDHIVITAGSREGLKAAGITYAGYGKEVIACSPTYKALMDYAARFGGYVNSVPLNDDLAYDLPEIEKRISNHTGLVFLCNPNNPTGTLLDGNEVRAFCERVSGETMVFADEVYYDYIAEPGYPSMIELVKEGLNVIVARTFSKIYGLAGARVGYLVARPEIAQRLNQNLQASSNNIACSAAIAAIKEKSFFDFSLQKNNEAREYVYTLCDELSLKYKRSHTNFVFFHTGIDIDELIPKMAAEGVLIGRPFPPLTDWCRISTGKMEEMEAFGAALKRVINA